MESVIVKTEGKVGRIILNRPESRNALSLELMNEVRATLQRLGSDPAVRVIVIEGAGPSFSAGHDMGEMLDRPAEFYDALFAECTAMMQAIHHAPQPVIAKVHGFATAAGCQLAASCDLVVAVDSARFATPGVKIGLFCTTPMVPVTRAVGRKRSMEMLLTGEAIDATTAQAWGLVNRVTTEADLENEVMRLVDQITQFSSDVIGTGKDAFYRQVGLHEDDAYSVTQPIMARSAAAPDAQEGFAAFLDKRRPDWNRREGDS